MITAEDRALGLVSTRDRCVCGHGPIMHVPRCLGDSACRCQRWQLGTPYDGVPTPLLWEGDQA